jgi:hypothetical protein
MPDEIVDGLVQGLAGPTELVCSAKVLSTPAAFRSRCWASRPAVAEAGRPAPPPRGAREQMIRIAISEAAFEAISGGEMAGACWEAWRSGPSRSGRLTETGRLTS